MVDVPKHIEFILTYDRYFRSQILYEAIALEASVDRIIARHFCPDEAKHGELVSFVFQEGEIGFNKKIRIVENLLKHSYPELKQAFGFLPKRLHALRELRNQFAHSEVVLPESPPPPEKAEGITLRHIKNGRVIDEFVSRDKVDALVNESNYIHLAAILLEMLIRKRVTKQLAEFDQEDIIRLVEAVRDSVQSTRKIP